MPYQIGKVFSDAVMNSIERGRDRSMQDQGAGVRRETHKGRAPADFEKALLDARSEREALAFQGQQADRDWELSLMELEQRRETALRSGDLKAARAVADEEKMLYDRAMGEREFDLKVGKENLGIDKFNAEQEGKGRDRALREKEQAFREKKWESEQEAIVEARKMEKVTNAGDALKTLQDLFSKGIKPERDSDKPSGATASAYARMILQAAKFAVEEKGLDPSILDTARQYARDLLASAGLGSVEGVEVDTGLDVALDTDDGGDKPPRLGR